MSKSIEKQRADLECCLKCDGTKFSRIECFYDPSTKKRFFATKCLKCGKRYTCDHFECHHLYFESEASDML